jgi:hypothetical protein
MKQQTNLVPAESLKTVIFTSTMKNRAVCMMTVMSLLMAKSWKLKANEANEVKKVGKMKKKAEEAVREE